MDTYIDVYLTATQCDRVRRALSLAGIPYVDSAQRVLWAYPRRGLVIRYHWK